MTTNCIPFSLVVSMTLLLMGCSKPDDIFDRANVTGIVTLDGKPLAEGVVYFVPINGTVGPKSFATIAQGEFAAAGEYAPIVGNHRIEIQSNDDGGIAFDDEEAMVQWVEKGHKPLKRVVVPAIYNKQSVLTADVAADGPNEYKFELSSKRRR